MQYQRPVALVLRTEISPYNCPFGLLYVGRIFTITTFKINTCYDTNMSVIKTFRAVLVNC
jgi:hypothetical protein